MENIRKTYLMRDQSTTYIKIGKSTKVFYREKTLQAEKPTIEGMFYVEDDIEKLLHSLFSEKRLRGEWFNLNQVDIDFIDQVLSQKGLIKKEFSLNDVVKSKQSDDNPPIVESQENDKKSNSLVESKQIMPLDYSDNIFVQSNDFIQVWYKEQLTFWESFLIAKMCSMIGPEDVDFKPYRIYMKEVVDFMELTPSGQVYTYIIDAAKRLLDRRIIIDVVNEFGRQESIETHIVTRVRDLLQPKQGENMYVTLTFLPELKPFLLQLHRDFTKLDMEIFKQLKTASSIRLYQIFKSHLGKKQHKITFKLDDLKEILGVSEKYGQYAGFKMRVLDEAQQRLSNKTDISFTYEEIKEGKKVSALIFHILNNKLKSQELPPKISLTKPIIVQQTEAEKENLVLELTTIVVKTFGVSLKVFMDLVETYTEGEIRKAIQVTEKAIQTGKVDNYAVFFVGALKNNYQDAALQKKKAEEDKIAEKKAKAATLKKIELDANEQKSQIARNESNRKISILKNLIQTNAPLMQQAIDELRQGMFRGGYDPTKTVAENLESAMFAGALMNVIQKIEPTVFQE